MRVCVCVCACVHARVCACVCVCAWVCVVCAAPATQCEASLKGCKPCLGRSAWRQPPGLIWEVGVGREKTAPRVESRCSGCKVTMDRVFFFLGVTAGEQRHPVPNSHQPSPADNLGAHSRGRKTASHSSRLLRRPGPSAFLIMLYPN